MKKDFWTATKNPITKNGDYIIQQNGNVIAHIPAAGFETDEACRDAALEIVHTVNLHDELVNACNNAKKELMLLKNSPVEVIAAIGYLEAALKNAETL